MRKKRIAKALGVFTIVCVGAVSVFWYLGHRPIDYHNSILRAAIGSATQVELSIVPKYGPDGYLLESEPPIFINDRSEIDRMLRNFELPWHLRASERFHECDGHLVVRIRMPDTTDYKIQYDHGKGIYPIYLEEDFPGFCDLSDDACADLNRYFFTLGFSRDDLGLSN
jgi:hypothetical protein